MPDVASDRKRRVNALKLLATYRQAEVDEKTAAAYLLGVSDLPPDVLEQACHDLGFRARDEHEAKWPELGTIRARCEAILRHRRELEQSRRLKLKDPDGEPVDPERWANFRADVQRNLDKKHSFR